MTKLIFATVFLSIIFGGILAAIKDSTSKEIYQATKFIGISIFCVILAILSLISLVVLF